MKYLLYIFSAFFLIGCQQIEDYKQDKAIEIVQQAKYGKHNLIKFGLVGLFLDGEMTNYEFANMMADYIKDDKLHWIAVSTENKVIYRVCLCRVSNNLGTVWIVNLENKMVTLDKEEK